jgi:ABC-type transport system involved in cytochrome bd biosynthesis fused ATPase/permease subunit
MTSLDFLYIALGGGFVLLVIFLCVMLLHLTLVLRDVTKVTANFTAISDRLRETVLEPMKTLSEMTAGLGFVHDLIEKIRRRAAEAAAEEDLEQQMEAECGECRKPARESKMENKKTAKKTGIFSVKKVGK